jgi:hypothetical protein
MNTARRTNLLSERYPIFQVLSSWLAITAEDTDLRHIVGVHRSIEGVVGLVLVWCERRCRQEVGKVGSVA